MPKIWQNLKNITQSLSNMDPRDASASKNVVQPMRIFCTSRISWKGISDWLPIVFHFGTENWEEQLKKSTLYTKICFFAFSRTDLVSGQHRTSSWNRSIRWWVQCSTVPPRSVGEGEKVGDLKDKTHKDTLRHVTTKWNRDTRSPCLYLYFKCWHTKRQSML